MELSILLIFKLKIFVLVKNVIEIRPVEGEDKKIKEDTVRFYWFNF